MSNNTQTSTKINKNDIEYGDYTINVNSCDKYSITDVLGKGKYSLVFKGKNKETKQKVVIKVLKPIKQQKINREVCILNHLSSHKNVIELVDVVYDKPTKSYSLIFNYIDHEESYAVLRSIDSYKDIVHYCKNILEGLRSIHNDGIVHRDIKPGNLIFNTNTKEVKIIDFGLAEVFTPNTPYCVRVCTKSYKAPELLTNNEFYGFPIDIWSFGAILAEAMAYKQPFFSNKKSENVLYEIARLLGKKDLKKYMKKYELEHNDFTKQVFRVEDLPLEKVDFRKITFKTPKTEEDKQILGELIKIMEMCLRYDPEERPTAAQLLNLKIFQ